MDWIGIITGKKTASTEVKRHLKKTAKKAVKKATKSSKPASKQKQAPAKKANASTSRKGITKTGVNAPISNLPDIELPAGNKLVEVKGLQWCKVSLSQNNDRVFSLTPKNTYQIEQGWPEGEILNVCRKGSKRATDKNWVGYISQSDARALAKTVLGHGTTNVHARVEVSDGKKSVYLMLP